MAKYQVKASDNPLKLAQKFRTTPSALLRENGLVRLTPGQLINVPGSAGKTPQNPVVTAYRNLVKVLTGNTGNNFQPSGGEVAGVTGGSLAGIPLPFETQRQYRMLNVDTPPPPVDPLRVNRVSRTGAGAVQYGTPSAGGGLRSPRPIAPFGEGGGGTSANINSAIFNRVSQNRVVQEFMNSPAMSGFQPVSNYVFRGQQQPSQVLGAGAAGTLMPAAPSPSFGVPGASFGEATRYSYTPVPGASFGEASSPALWPSEARFAATAGAAGAATSVPQITPASRAAGQAQFLSGGGINPTSGYIPTRADVWKMKANQRLRRISRMSQEELEASWSAGIVTPPPPPPEGNAVNVALNWRVG